LCSAAAGKTGAWIDSIVITAIVIPVAAIRIPITTFAAATSTRVAIALGNDHDVLILMTPIHPSGAVALAISAELNLHVGHLRQNDWLAGGR